MVLLKTIIIFCHFYSLFFHCNPPVTFNANAKGLMQNWYDEPCYSKSFKRRDCSRIPQKFSNSSTQTGAQARLQQAILGNLKRICAWTEHFLGFVNDSTLLHQSFLKKQKRGKCKAWSIWINNSNTKILVYLNWPFIQQHAHIISPSELLKPNK